MTGSTDHSQSRAEREIHFGADIAQVDTELLWGWGTPAGALRARRRGLRIIEAGGLKPGVRALEIGCGTGMFTEIFSSSGAAITAVDISPELLAKARLRHLPEDRVRFQEARFEDLDSADKFDAVIGSSVLHHLEVESALKKIRMLLKPDGVLVFAEPNMLNPQVFLERKLRFLPIFRHISPDETAFVRWSLASLMKNVGFKDISIRPMDWLHPSVPEPMIPFVTGVEKVLEAIPLIKEFSGSVYIRARV